MPARIFIAINLPEEVKKNLKAFQLKWFDLPCRWLKPENLHLTLVFLGFLSDQELLLVLKITSEVASRHSSFSINLNKICYGPPKKMPPRLIWAEGEKSIELRKLQNDLENSLCSSSIKGLSGPEARPYTPHITLARIRQWQFRQIEPEERPIIDEDISLSFKVNSIEVMESQLKRSGAEYTILESYPLSGNSKSKTPK